MAEQWVSTDQRDASPERTEWRISFDASVRTVDTLRFVAALIRRSQQQGVGIDWHLESVEES